MRVLDPIVEVLRAAMLDRCQQLAVGDLVAAEFVGDDHPRHVLQVFEQLAEESFGGHRISAGLDQNVEHVAVLVDRAPQVVLRAVDPDEHFVAVPFLTGPWAASAQPAGVGLPELGAPASDRLVTHRDTAYEHQLLDLTEAEREPKVQPHAVVDDLDRGTGGPARPGGGGGPPHTPRSPTPTNVTVPAAGEIALSDDEFETLSRPTRCGPDDRRVVRRTLPG